jgi:GNAT superfamily N-acetyltransferase
MFKKQKIDVPIMAPINKLTSVYITGYNKKMKPNYRIIPAKPEHLAALPGIERAAASIFPPELLSSEQVDHTTPLVEFDSARARGMLWVAVTLKDKPVGFAIAEEHGPVLHLEELDVHPQYHQQGIGTMLLTAVCQYALRAGYQGISLTTFSQIPWNSPWYQKLGFQVLQENELSSELKSILKDEARRGLDPKLRVAMYHKFEN